MELPDFLVRLAAMRDPAVQQILPELGKRKNGSNEKARRLLGWRPRSNEECIVATAQSMIDLGLLSVEGGKQKVVDGPFAETREALGGYYLIKAETIEDALAWAAKCPGARYGRIEVRPVVMR
jgi:hypothetical protein